MSTRHSQWSLGLVDNDTLALGALSSYLKSHLKMACVAWATSSPDKARQLCLTKTNLPDLILIDMSMPQIDGISLIRTIRERNGRLRILAMTSFPLKEYAQDAADAGAQGITSKGNPPQLLKDIATVLCHETMGTISALEEATVFGTPNDAYSRLAASSPSGIDRLNDLERAITELCRQGYTSTQIAQQLAMNQSSVSTHIKRACEKMGAKNRVQLVAMVMEQSRPRH